MDEDLYLKHKNYYLNKKEDYNRLSFLAANSVTQMILAPLYVISISKQLSVTEHKHIYYDFLGTNEKKIEKLTYREKLKKLLFKSDSKVENSKITDTTNKSNNKGVISEIESNNSKSIENVKSILKNNNTVVEKNNSAIQNLEGKYGALMNNEGEAKINKIKYPITVRDHINKNLVEASGVPEGQTPYRAAIFDNYKQMFKAFNKQGILSFWKGTFYRIAFVSGSLTCSNYLNNIFDQKIKKHFKNYYMGLDLLNNFISLTLSEMLCHPFFLLENRYVLQNRLPHFRVYQSILTVQSRIYLDLYNFCSVHIVKNLFLFSFMYFLTTIFKSDANNNRIILSFISSAFTYPFYTVIRRLVCQDIKTAGMIPNRYYNLIHGLAIIKKEEGIKNGLYKGFLPFSIASIIYLNFVPITQFHIFDNYCIKYFNPFLRDETLDALLV